eukprot:g7475.t1
MTALIADTSPVLRNIPSDPPGDHRRSFEFSPSPMPARYLPDGDHTQTQQDHRHPSPSPRGFNARKVPAALYPQPHHYGYTLAGAFAHHSGVAVKSCSSSNNSQQTAQQVSCSEPQSAMWRNNESNDNARQDAFHAEATTSARAINPGEPAAVSVSAPSRSPSPSAVLAQHRDHPAIPAIELTSSPAKKSDWENLLGAVDLELRAQERAELVPDSTTGTAVPAPHNYAHAINAAHHHHRQQQCSPVHHPGRVGMDSGSRYTQSAAVSPEFGPIKATAPRHHRRGGAEDLSAGAPAYSGSTADAACLLATLPQRMLDRASTSKPPPPYHPQQHHHHATGGGGGGGGGMMPSPRPALVSAAGPPVTPVRVQASGRRGPRGQSRFKGVCITRAGKWRAVIYIGRKQKYLGVFDSEFDAARAYDAAALEHFAEGAKLNFPDGIEQQLNELSSGVSGRPFATAGAGGEAAPRSTTPPAYNQDGVNSASSPSSGGGNKRSRKSAFGEHDDEWVRETGPWNSSRI